MFQTFGPQTRKTRILLVFNMTPDSFSDGGRWQRGNETQNIERILEQIERAITNGFRIDSDILDIGGESTRPGASAIPVGIELARVLPAIQAIRARYPMARISVDTRKAAVAKEAVDAGARIINDVSGLQFDPELAPLAANTGSTLVLTHSIGTPETMQKLAKEPGCYPNGITQAVCEFFNRTLPLAKASGIPSGNIILDPGFGFGKTIGHNLTLLKELHRIKAAFPGYSILAGTSRKSFLTLGQPASDPATRDTLTAASVFDAIAHGGADIVRIHSLEAVLPAVRLAEAYALAQEVQTIIPEHV